jgi:protein ImuB
VPEARTLATLRRWGLSTVGELARLPEAEVVSRLGAVGQELQALARGEDPRPLVPRQPPPAFREGMELEWPLVSLEPFLFMARAALDRLAERMAGHALACQRLELVLELEPAGFHERSITLPAPSRDVRTLLELLRLDLEGHPPAGPILAFTLTAHPDRPRPAQLSLFGPAALSPEKLATTLARLFAMLGEERVGSPRTVDGHRPERFALVPYAPPAPPEVRQEPRRGRGLLAVRVLRPPLAVEVLTGEEAARPAELRGTVADDTTEKRPRVEGRVRVASGPWGLEEGWWSGDPVARDYWDVELAQGGLYRLYRERGSGDWFVDGIYD